MIFQNTIIAFLVGGVVVAAITFLEDSNMRVWSGIAALTPTLTVISYFFIGHVKNAHDVSQHAKFILIGTVVSWIPYMMAIIVLAPKIGTNRSVGIGLLVFCILSALYVIAVQKLNLFR